MRKLRFWRVKATLSGSFCALSVFLLSLIVFAGLLLWKSSRAQVAVADEGLDLMEKVIRDVDEISREIERFGLHSCSRTALTHLRKLTSINPVLSDIGLYFDDRLACTTIAGRFSKPRLDPPTDFLSYEYGSNVWTDRSIRSLGVQVGGIAARIDNRLFMMKPLFLGRRSSMSFDWQLIHFYPGSDQSFHADGMRGLADGVRPTPLRLTSKSLYIQRCDSWSHYCVAVDRDYQDILRSNGLISGLGGAAASLLGCLAFIVRRRSFMRQLGPVHRTRAALRAWTFECHYQPLIDLTDDGVVGCEALARLSDEHGMLSPGEFIPVIHELGWEDSFTRQMLEQAVADIRTMRLDRSPFKLAVNIFPANLNSQFVDFVVSCLDRLPEGVVLNLEITEDATISEAAYQEAIQRLSSHGVEISLDDFGTGYCTLGRLDTVGVDTLKVDRSLISTLTPDSCQQSLTAYVPKLAQQAGVAVVAEGIEGPDSLAAVKSLGMHYAQGFYFGRPMNVSGFQELLDRDVYR
ncbi:EAL domain-containing protein [Tamilnaduibacter salinus]|nr:EAL domain-containing protein [Tamilnaduibacter salinus]